MNDDGESNGDSGAVPRKRVNWDAVTALVAVVIALLATLVSAYAAWEQRQQTRAQVWPHLTVGAVGVLPGESAKSSHGGGLMVDSGGVGPAIVSRVEVLVDGKPASNWNDVFKALGYPSGKLNVAASALAHNVFPPARQEYILTVFGHEDWLVLKHKIVGHVVIRVCYRSALGEHWMTTMKHSGVSTNNHPVGSCSEIAEKDEFNG
jgi:hypothetical protein